jgi:hypothetical protein
MIWKYFTSTQEWAWIIGSSTLVGGSTFLSNYSHVEYTGATYDPANNRIFVIGGYGGQSNPGSTELVWEISCDSNSVVGASGDGSARNIATTFTSGDGMGARRWHSTSDFTIDGKVFVYGGYYNFPSPDTSDHFFSYDPDTDTWEFLSGRTSGPRTFSSSVWGTQYTSDAANRPYSAFGTSMWTPDQGTIYMGFGNRNSDGHFDNLWKYQYQTAPTTSPTVSPSLSPPSSSPTTSPTVSPSLSPSSSSPTTSPTVSPSPSSSSPSTSPSTSKVPVDDDDNDEDASGASSVLGMEQSDLILLAAIFGVFGAGLCLFCVRRNLNPPAYSSSENVEISTLGEAHVVNVNETIPEEEN